MGVAIVAKNAPLQTASLVEAFPPWQRFTSPREPRIAFKVKGRILFINPGDVVAVQSEGNYVWLRLETISHLLRESLSVVAEKLEPHGFIRIHRSVLVNASFVEEIRPYPDGRIWSARQRRERIHSDPHLQEESQIPGSLLAGHRRLVFRLTKLVPPPDSGLREAPNQVIICAEQFSAQVFRPGNK